MVDPGSLCESSLGCFWKRRIIHPFILHSSRIPAPSTGVSMHAQQRTAALLIIILWRRGWSGRTSQHLSCLQAPQICICTSAGSLAPLICLVGGQRARPRQVTAFGSRARPVGTSFPKSVLSHRTMKAHTCMALGLCRNSLLEQPCEERPTIIIIIITIIINTVIMATQEAYGILVPPPGIEPIHLTLKAWSPNHWPAREFLWGPMIILNLMGESMVSGLISDGARIWGFSRDLDFYFISTVVSEYSL